MFTLFFGNLWSTLSTVLLIAVLIYIILTAAKHRKIKAWGRKTLILAITGLLLCIFVVLRDDYAEALQGGTGLFSLESLQINLAYLGGAVIGFSTLSSVFIRNQKYRKIMFFILSGALIFKVGLIEISRIVMFLGAR